MVKKLHLYELVRMISLMKNKKWLYFLALILGCGINSISNILSALVNKNMINAAESGNVDFMIKGIALAIVAFSIGAIVFPICIYIKVRIIKHVVCDIRLDVFNHIEHLPIAYYDKNHSGELTSRLINDINLIDSAYNDQMQLVGVAILGGLGSAITMFSLDWKLASITIIIGIISARINISYTSSLRKIANSVQSSVGILNQFLVDILSAYRTSRMFNISGIMTGKFITQSNKIGLTTLERAQKNSQLSFTNYLFGILSMLGIYLLGGFMVAKGRLDFGTVVAIVTLQKGINFMFSNFGNFFAQLQSSLAGASRIFEILDQRVEPDQYVLDSPTNNNNMLALNNVTFSYNHQTNLLENLTIEVPKGETVALVGMSGAGKSTLSKLFMGFYAVHSGSIIINGKSINQYTLKQLRQLVAYVPQDSYLFDGTIEENIRYGNVNATQQEMIEASQKANAHPFIMQMTNGYQTNVGERGSKLSGGQKQRICLARAFIKNAPILILDEPTSALDVQAQKLVQDGLNTLMQGRTVLVIAHRLSTIEKADRVYVVENGGISEVGTHNELIENSVLYKKLYDTSLMKVDNYSCMQ
jgi:ABC-type multidrug transport system fused ATPase/permease subunit